MSKKIDKVDDSYHKIDESIRLYTDPDSGSYLPHEATLAEFSRAVNRLKKLHPGTAMLKLHCEEWGGDCFLEPILEYTRDETEEERKHRMDLEQISIDRKNKRAGSQRERELKQLKSLMKKHGVNNIDDIKV